MVPPTNPHLVLRLKRSEAIPLLPLCTCMAHYVEIFTFYSTEAKPHFFNIMSKYHVKNEVLKSLYIYSTTSDWWVSSQKFRSS